MLAILAVHCVWALLLGVFYKAKPELQQEKIEKSGLTRWKYVFFIFLMVVVGFTYEYLSDKYYFRPKLEELINDYKK